MMDFQNLLNKFSRKAYLFCRSCISVRAPSTSPFPCPLPFRIPLAWPLPSLVLIVDRLRIRLQIGCPTRKIDWLPTNPANLSTHASPFYGQLIITPYPDFGLHWVISTWLGNDFTMELASPLRNSCIELNLWSFSFAQTTCIQWPGLLILTRSAIETSSLIGGRLSRVSGTRLKVRIGWDTNMIMGFSKFVCSCSQNRSYFGNSL